MKISNKIFSWFLVIALIPSAITGFFGYQIGQGILKKYVYNQLSGAAEGIHGRLNGFLEVKKERIVDFSSDGFIRDNAEIIGYYGNTGSKTLELSNHLAKNKKSLDPDILETFVTDMTGRVIASSNTLHIGLNRPDEDYLTGLKSEDIHVTDLHHCPEADEPVIEVSRLLRSRNRRSHEPIGAIVNRIKGSSITNLFERKDSDRNNAGDHNPHLTTYIVNGGNRVVAGSHVNRDDILKMVMKTLPVVRFSESGEEITDIYQGSMGNRVFGMSMYDDKMDWLILVEEDVKTVFADMNYLRNYIIIMKVITLFIVLLLAVYVSKGITSPIKQLMEGTKKLAGGMLNYRINLSNNDEIGELSGSFNTMAGSIQERTEVLYKTRDYLKNILNNTYDMVITTDSSGNIVEFNKGAEMILGYKAEDVIGEGVEYFYLDRSKKRELMHRLECEGSIVNYETVLRTKQGNVIDMVITISQLKDNSGNVIGTVDVGKEITEKKKWERKLKTAKKSAEEANTAKSAFLANMSHEIRTPMSGVIGMTDLLLDTELTREQLEYAGAIRDSAKSLLTIINDILDFSKIEAGKLELEKIDFDVRVVMENVMDVFAFRAEEKGLELSCFIDPEAPSLLRGDSGRLRQVLINLVGNAIKFTKDGEVAVDVQQVKKTEQVVTLRFNVRDTGIGIPPDHVNRLFQSFSQVDASTTRKYGGTGLGLAISKQITNLMGGEIGIESKNSSGSVFWFTVVLEKSPSDTKHLQRKSKDIDCLRFVSEKNRDNVKKSSEHLVTRYTLSEKQKLRVRILLAEDNIINQKIALRILDTKLGYQADVVTNGKEALESLQKFKYDLVLMDCQMPEMDGYEATRAIRNNQLDLQNPNIPIIAMTANAMKGDREKCLEAGMDDYITKPINMKKLSETINLHLSL